MRRALSLTYNASLFVYYKSLLYRPMQKSTYTLYELSGWGVKSLGASSTAASPSLAPLII